MAWVQDQEDIHTGVLRGTWSSYLERVLDAKTPCVQSIQTSQQHDRQKGKKSM